MLELKPYNDFNALFNDIHRHVKKGDEYHRHQSFEKWESGGGHYFGLVQVLMDDGDVRVTAFRDTPLARGNFVDVWNDALDQYKKDTVPEYQDVDIFFDEVFLHEVSGRNGGFEVDVCLWG